MFLKKSCRVGTGIVSHLGRLDLEHFLITMFEFVFKCLYRCLLGDMWANVKIFTKRLLQGPSKSQSFG